MTEMTREEALELLKGGPEGIRKWNEQILSKKVRTPNLQGVDLRSAFLQRVIFFGVRLSAANLDDADLTGAFVSGTDLSVSELKGTNLSEAKCLGSDFSRANLWKANMSKADLVASNLSKCFCQGTDFSNAIFGETTFNNVDLSEALGLETCLHESPSSIDFQTLALSAKLPKSFLRGCGLPDGYITYIQSLVSNPIEFYSCFISYSHQDEIFAERLYADLQNNGVRCWYAPEDMKGGKKLHHQIDDAIRLHDKLLSF